MKAPPTLARVREVVEYDPRAGTFTWRVRTSIRIMPGAIAGTKKADSGYVLVGIDGVQYRAHRLAWFMMTGDWPSGDVDHINGVRHDNRWSNIRVVTSAVNGQNRRRAQRDNRLGVLGVFQCKKRYQAQVKLNGVVTHLGTFDTPEQAHEAYVEAKRRLHEGCTL